MFVIVRGHCYIPPPKAIKKLNNKNMHLAKLFSLGRGVSDCDFDVFIVFTVLFAIRFL